MIEHKDFSARKGNLKATAVIALAFSLLFAAFGGKPLFGVLRARGWDETPCVVVVSQLKRHSPKGPNRHPYSSIDIHYTYKVSGKAYRSNRYWFMGALGVNDSRSRAVIVARHPVGTKTSCYVNPENPEEAVMNRDLSSSLVVSFALPFILLVYAGGKYVLLQREEKAFMRCQHSADE